MRSTAIIRNGNLLLSKELRELVEQNPESECDIEIHVINKPAHYLYKYLHGYLIRDIVNHSGIEEDDLVYEFKTKFAIEFVDDWSEVPRRHRRKCQRYINIITDKEGCERENKWYLKSCSSMTHEELKEYVLNIERHFFDFMEGALDKKKQYEANKFRKIGMMNDKEYKKYLKNTEGDRIV